LESQQNNVYLAACAIYRNEARYLREWIEFHRLVGFERFYLYDNESDDDHLAVLEPYIAEGVVVLERWPISPGQHLAYEDCLSKRRGEAYWIAFFDIDEFMFSPTGATLSLILGDFHDAPGVVVNIAVFGTSDHEAEPDGLVIENYVRRAPDGSAGSAVKCIVNPTYGYHCFGAHAFLYLGWTEELRGARFEQPEFVPVDPVNERHERIPIRHQTPELSYDLLRVNHYWTKAGDVHREKWQRHRSDTGELREPVSQAMMDLLNSEQDETIQMYVPALREAVQERARR
jgi:hypothetical protein